MALLALGVSITEHPTEPLTLPQAAPSFTQVGTTPGLLLLKLLGVQARTERTADRGVHSGTQVPEVTVVFP